MSSIVRDIQKAAERLRSNTGVLYPRRLILGKHQMERLERELGYRPETFGGAEIIETGDESLLAVGD